MPSIKDESTVEAIARVFCGEGKRNKTETLRIVGYSEGYADNGTSSVTVFGNVRVKAAIAKIDKREAEIGHRTVAGLDKLYASCYDQAQANNQPSAMVSAVTGIARLYGLDKDVQVAAELPTSITVADAERYRDMADAATADNLNKPKLSKGA